MANMVSVLIKFFKTSELTVRLVKTALYLLLFRIGSNVVLPGIDSSVINGGSGGLLDLLDSFVGGAFRRRSVFSLGVMPYISASIIIHMMTLLFPTFQRIQHDGESGRRKIHQYTKYLSIIICIVQSISFFSADIHKSELLINKTFFIIVSTFVLLGGSMACVWIGERITDNGIGQGISILILVGIVSSFPSAIYSEYILKQGDLMKLFFEYFALLVVISLIIAVSMAVRKIKLLYVREVIGYEELNKKRQYLPIKLISAGVMPIIFGNVILMFVAFLCNLLSGKSTIALNIYSSLKDPLSFGYNITFSILVIIFTYLYTSINVNPMKIANDLKSNSCFIPGIRPGTETAKYIDSVLDFTTFYGAISLAIIAFLPVIANYFEVGYELAHFYGGTSMLISIPLAIESWKQVKSYWLLYKYDNIENFGE